MFILVFTLIVVMLIVFKFIVYVNCAMSIVVVLIVLCQVSNVLSCYMIKGYWNLGML